MNYFAVMAGALSILAACALFVVVVNAWDRWGPRRLSFRDWLWEQTIGRIRALVYRLWP